jgi:hypothetical protein
MRRPLPWVIALPIAFAGSWTAHMGSRAIAAGSIEGSEASERLERASITHVGALPLAVTAVLAPFVAIALIVFAAWLWTKVRGRSLRGAGASWFLTLPAFAYVTEEVLERLTSSDRRGRLGLRRVQPRRGWPSGGRLGSGGSSRSQRWSVASPVHGGPGSSDVQSTRGRVKMPGRGRSAPAPPTNEQRRPCGDPFPTTRSRKRLQCCSIDWRGSVLEERCDRTAQVRAPSDDRCA